MRAHFVWIAGSAAVLGIAAWCGASGGVASAAEGVGQLPPGAVIPSDAAITAAQRAKIERAIPATAPAAPAKPRKLLIFDVNVGYGGHGSIVHANLAFTLMGRKTGAFETTVSRDPSVFRPERLRDYDAVFFNNTVGNPFDDRGLRESLLEFVRRGGGLMGVHGTTATFVQWPGGRDTWPEFGEMLGGRGTNHREPNERVVVKLDDPTHPINRVFDGKSFENVGEFFRVSGPYSRERVRVLLSIDVAKSNLDREPYRGRRERPDQDYALAWVRQYGRGRVFYSTIGHGPEVFVDPVMLKFYLAATQFVLGDLSGPTEPSRPAAAR